MTSFATALSSKGALNTVEKFVSPAERFINPAEWAIDAGSARHKTGLVIRYERLPKQKKKWLDIEGIQKLAGTPWEQQANVLIEQGIALIEKGARPALT